MRLLLKDSTLIKLLAKLSANNIMLTAHLFSSFFLFIYLFVNIMAKELLLFDYVHDVTGKLLVLRLILH